MSAEPVDSCTQVTVSGNAEPPSPTRNGGLSNLASPAERALIHSDTGDGYRDERKNISYFDSTTGTSITRITSEMFNKPKHSGIRSEHNSSVEYMDSNRRCSCETDPHKACAGECAKRLGHGMGSSGAGQSLKGQGCFEEVGSSSSAHAGGGHSLDVELDNDRYSSEILFIDEQDFESEEKVMYIDDKDEQAASEPVVTHQVKEPAGYLRDPKRSSDVSKHLSFGALEFPRKESAVQSVNERLRGDLAEAYKENKMEGGGIGDQLAVGAALLPESGWQETVVTDHNKTTNVFSSMPKSLNVVEANDCRSKISPGPLRLTKLAKSTAAQPETSYSINTPSFFSAYPQSDVNINNSVCQTSVGSVSSILSLDSRTSNRDETKGRTKDRGSFAPDFTDSSCRADASDSWTELEDLPSSQSFDKLNIDDLTLSKSDKQGASGHPEACGGLASHCGTSSHVELDHVEVEQVLSEKLKLMQDRRKKKLNRLKAGVIDSSSVSGNKGDRPIEELLEFINSKETEHGKSKKASQKAKKQQQQQRVVPLSERPFTIEVTVTEEILYNWQTPDATSSVPNGFLMHDEGSERAENSVKVIKESSNGSCSVTVPGATYTLCGFAAQKESGECPETVDKTQAGPSSNGVAAEDDSSECSETANRPPRANPSSNGFSALEESSKRSETVKKPKGSRPSLANAIGAVANGFQEGKELGGTTARVEKRKRKEKAALQASSTVEPSCAVAEQALTDPVTATSSSSFKSTSDSSSETVATDDNDSSRDFTVVQKRKRNKNTHAEKSKRAETESSSLEFGRSRTQNGRKVDGDGFKVFTSNHHHHQQHRKLASTADNRHPVHPTTWGTLLKDKPTGGEVLGKNSSGDSSETSSVCSASVLRESTSFAKVASGNTAGDAVSQSACRNSEAPAVLYNDETPTPQSDRNPSESQQNADDAACIGNIKPGVSPDAAGNCPSSSQDTVVIPASAVDGLGKAHGTFTDTGLCSDLNGISLPSGKVSSCHSSMSYQETTLSSAAGESSRASGRSPVVFDTREKARFLVPASDIEISFWFDAEDDGTPKAEAEEQTDSATVVASTSEAKSSFAHCSQTAAPESADCNVAVDINSNHPRFQNSSSVNKSPVIPFPSHAFQPSASQMSLIYGSPHPLPLGVGYVVPMPVPVGIVPPFMTCNSRSLSSATVIAHPAFERKDFMGPLIDESTCKKQERHGAEICAALAPPAHLMVLAGVPQELPSVRSPPSSKVEGRSSYFDLAAAQEFLCSEFEAAVSSGSKIVYLTIDD